MSRTRRFPWRLIALLALGLLLLGWELPARVPLPSAGSWPPPGWLVAQCDVGQGSATVLRSGRGRGVLLDAGPEPRALDRCLRRLRVHTLDLVVLSHYHQDHVGGLPALAGRGVGRVLATPLAAPRANAEWARATAARSGGTVEAVTAGTHGQVGQTWSWQVLWPPATTGSGHVGEAPGHVGDESGDGANDASVVTVWRHAHLEVAVLGDIEEPAQRGLLAGGNLPPVDVVVVAHHGSAKQVPSLYSALGARIALIGVGRDNDYGHPASATVRLLTQTGARVARTDLHGDVALGCLDPSCARVQVWRAPP